MWYGPGVAISRSLLSSVAALASTVCILIASGACTSVTSIRLHPDAVATGPNQRAIAAIQANAASAYILFVPLPNNVELDQVVNRMLIATAKAMGADKIAQLSFEITPDDGIWALRKVLGWRSARASGVAVQITGPPVDARADEGPEPSLAHQRPHAPAEAPDAGTETPQMAVTDRAAPSPKM